MSDRAGAMLGRDRELQSLLRAAAATAAGAESNVVLVHGEPGIGKSTLLNAFMAELARADPPFLVGYGQAMTSSLGSDSFQAVRECLRVLVSSAGTSAARSGSRAVVERVAQAFVSNAPAWLEAVPMVGGLLSAGVQTGKALSQLDEPVESRLSSPLDELTALVNDLAAVRPVVLILDDLHWAESATIDLVMALALKVQGPFLLVLAYRADDLRRGPDGEPHPMMRAVFRLRRYRPTMVELPLERLSPGDTRKLILAGSPGIDAAELDRLVVRSAGIPLYAESLAMVRPPAVNPGVEQHRDPISREIDAVLEERLSFVDPEDRRLLEAAVAVGFTFEVEFVAELARMDVDEVYDRLDALMRAHHLVVPAAPGSAELDRYSLSHPLLAEVLARQAAANPPRWRRTQHRLVDILLAAQPSDEVIVRAANAALAARDARAGELCLQAAGRSYLGGKIGQARRFAEAAVERLGDGQRLEAETLRIECLSAQGDHPQVVTVATHALADPVCAEEPERAHRLALLRARSLRMTADWPTLARALDELDELNPDEAPGVADQVLMLRAEIALGGPVQDVASCIEMCNRIAGRSADPGLVSRALGHRGLAHLAGYQPDAAEEWLTRAIEVAREGHPYAHYEAVFWYSKKKLACLELEAAWSQLELLAATSDRSGVASETPFHLRDSSRVLGLQGHPADAAATFARYADVTPQGSRDRVASMLCWQVAELETVRDRGLADRFLAELTSVLGSTVLDERRREAIAGWAARLSDRAADWQPEEFAVDVLNADVARARSAAVIFRFNVPDLARLRAVAGVHGP